MMYSGLMGRGLRLRVPDVSPASVAYIFRDAASTAVSEVMITSTEYTLYIDAGRESLNQYINVKILRCHPHFNVNPL